MLQQEGVPGASCKDALLWHRGAVQGIGAVEITFCVLGNEDSYWNKMKRLSAILGNFHCSISDHFGSVLIMFSLLEDTFVLVSWTSYEQVLFSMPGCFLPWHTITVASQPAVGLRGEELGSIASCVPEQYHCTPKTWPCCLCCAGNKSSTAEAGQDCLPSCPKTLPR